MLLFHFSLSVSAAEVCWSCCNPGTLPQSLLYRHSGYLRQRYDGTLQHIPLWPWLSVLRQEMFVTVDESSCVKLSLSLSLSLSVCVCVCVDRSRCRFAHSVAGPLQTSVPQTPSSGQELQHQKQVQLVLHVLLHCSYECVWFSVFEDDGTCATHASLNLRVSDFSSVLISGCCCPGRQLAGGRKWVAPAHPASCVCLCPRFVSAGFWMKSCRSWFSSFRRRIVWVRTHS